MKSWPNPDCKLVCRDNVNLDLSSKWATVDANYRFRDNSSPSAPKHGCYRGYTRNPRQHGELDILRSTGAVVLFTAVWSTPAGAVFTHLAEEEQGQACDWNHMQGRQVMRVISHTAAAELVSQTARGSLPPPSCADRWRDSHLSVMSSGASRLWYHLFRLLISGQI